MTPFHGAAYVLRGLRLIKEPGIRMYAVIPLLINMILFIALLIYLALRIDVWVNALTPDLPAWLQWLHWLIWLVAALSALILSFFAVSLLANLIAAPFNEALAERVEHFLAGEREEQTGSPWFHGALKALANEARKLGYFLVRAVPLLLLYLIPGVNVLAPLLWVLFSAWMLAVEYTDYPMGNNGLGFDAQRHVLSRHRALSVGFGAAVLGLTAIPLLNIIIMPAAVAGATALWVERLKGTAALHPDALLKGGRD